MSVSASCPTPPLGGHLCENGFKCVEILPFTNDDHGGVIVDLKDATDSEVFAALLKSSLIQWKKQVVITYYVLVYIILVWCLPLEHKLLCIIGRF